MKTTLIKSSQTIILSFALILITGCNSGKYIQHASLGDQEQEMEEVQTVPNSEEVNEQVLDLKTNEIAKIKPSKTKKAKSEKTMDETAKSNNESSSFLDNMTFGLISALHTAGNSTHGTQLSVLSLILIILIIALIVWVLGGSFSGTVTTILWILILVLLILLLLRLLSGGNRNSHKKALIKG